MKENYLTPIAILIAGGLIAWGIMSNDGTSQNNPDNNGNNDQPKVAEVSKQDYILGNPDAEIILIEYSDIECPFCKRFHETTQKLMKDYQADGKLALIFRHFPIDQLHSKARKEAIAVECAGKLGGSEKFWAYLNETFATTNSNNSLDLNLLPVIAENIGLDKDSFVSCLDNKEIADKVKANQQSGIDAGVRGTPHSFLITKDGNITPINGAVPYESVKAMIESKLK